MTNDDRLRKSLAAYQDRLQGFIKDDYDICYIHAGVTLNMTKLRHRRNGNIVTLKLYADGRLVQHTNGKETHSEVY